MSAAIATSDPRASAVGARLLAEGAHAIDAAVAAALVLYVVEPQQCGPGGDGFLFHVEPGHDPVALDGSGELPRGLTDDALARAGLDVLPPRGALTATVPGALTLLEQAVERWGTRTLAELAGPAIQLARQGFEVRPTLATAAGRALDTLADDLVLGPLYAPSGRPVDVGDTITNPALADLLELVAHEGAATALGGQVGASIADFLQSIGGVLSTEDMAEHRPREIALSSTTFRGRRVWQLPPPTQGTAVLRALDEVELLGDRVVDWLPVIEIMRGAMAGAGFDLDSIGVAPRPATGDTTYLAAVDDAGRAVSLITSIFGDFGAHVGVPVLGAPIGNRATMLRALRLPMNPGGKPPHTTIPGAVTRDGELEFVLGVAGGFMQPQAQVQILIHLLEANLEPQAAIDMPRFRIGFGGTLSLEAGHPLCEQHPDAAARPPGPEGYGAAQAVGWVEGRLTAGADHRRGGSAMLVSPPTRKDRT